MAGRIQVKVNKLLSLLTTRMAVTVLLVMAQMAFFAFEIYQLSNYYIYIDIFLRILSFAVVSYIIYQPEMNPSSKLAWVVPILILPLFGGLMYVLFGHVTLSKKLRGNMEKAGRATRHAYQPQKDVWKELEQVDKQAANLSRYIAKYSKAAMWKNSKANYLKIGEEYWVSLLRDLEKARKFIFVEYFIMESGDMWDSVHDILRKKVKEGVEVRVMYDDVGSSFVLPSHYHERLEKEGIKCVAFNRIKPLMALILNNRDHRKIVVIDGKIGYTGGANMADEYINRKVKYGHWKDTGVRIEGDAVWNFTVMFLQLWNAMRFTEDDYSPYNYKFPKDTFQDGYIQPYGDTPLDKETLGENIYLNIINMAREYVYIYSPYLVLSNEMITSLSLAAKRGVDVRIVTPGIPDKKMVYWLTQSNYSVLIKAGVRILQYTPGFIHAKCFLSDDKIATVGTINMDYRSFYHHFECGTFLYGTSVTEELFADMQEVFKVSEEITEEWIKEHFALNFLVGPVLKLLSPLL